MEKNSDLKKRVRNKPTDRKLSELGLKDRRLIERKSKNIKKTANKKDNKSAVSSSKKGRGRKPAPYLSVSSKSNTKAFDISSISSHLTSIGLDTKHDDFDLLDLYASHIIELINEGVYIFSNLTKHERFILFRYFYRTNPVLGRIIDIHTEIPISKMRLQAPKNCPEIVKDYIVQFYEKIFDRVNMTEVLRDLVLHYWIYGEAYCLVDDYYKEFGRELQKIESIDEKMYIHSPEDSKFMKDIEEKYKTDPESVPIIERRQYLEKKFIGFFRSDYDGPDRLRVLKFFDIGEYYHNEDIGFEAIRYALSDGLRDLLSGRIEDEELLEMGYTKGFISLLDNPENNSRGSIFLENNSYSGEPFIFVFKRYDSTSMMNRIFESCLGWENAKRALKTKIGQIGRLGRIVTSDGLGDTQTDELRAEVEQMINDPNHAIVANYPINWEEINSFFKEELQELIDSTDGLKEEIAMGTGMPDSLISGDSQYSGDNIKLDILNNQYFSFKITVQNLLEDFLLKPISLRKGFVTVDSWGCPILLYPKLTFSRVSLRSEDYFDLLFDLYQKNSLPISVIYDLLNLDSDDITRAIQEDLFTLKDATFNDLLRDIYTQLSESIVSKTDLAEKIIDGLGLPRKENVEEEEEEIPSNNFKRW